MFAPSKHRRASPAKTANFISVLFFSWLDPLLKKGLKQAIKTDDLFAVADSNSADYLGQRLQRCWEEEKKKRSEAGKKPSFQAAVLKCFWLQILIMGFAVAFEEAARVSQPLLLAYMLEYFVPGEKSEDEVKASTLRAYLYAAALTIASTMSAVMHHPFYFYNSVIGMRMRIASCSMIYRKTLRLSRNALASTTTGHIITLMSTDAARFDLATSLIHYFWLAPIQAAVVLGILWTHIGPASLSGYAMVLLFIPVQGILGKAFAVFRMKTAEQTDRRVQLMDQVITGMKVIKMYCWEKPLAELVASVRRREMKSIGRMAGLSMVSYDFGYFTFSKLGVAACILAVVLVDGHMPSLETIIVLMRLMGTVQDSLAYYLPQAVQIWSEMATTCQRIQEFLELEEVESGGTPTVTLSEVKRSGIELKKYSGKWERGSGALTIQNVTLSVAPGELLAIVGPVGAGKTSVLMAILGELPRTSGERRVRGRIAYASQEPWILSATVRQNIIFGSQYRADRYASVIEACDLGKDIASFSLGDQTLVGERGVMLSGGQRARVGLARALYQDADTYLLDDPLSAVDIVVARRLYDRCIRGLLASNVCVLVTHQIHFVEEAAQVIVLMDGAVKCRGTYDELTSSGVDFEELLTRASPPGCREDKPAKFLGSLQSSYEDEIVKGDVEGEVLLPIHCEWPPSADNDQDRSSDDRDNAEQVAAEREPSAADPLVIKRAQDSHGTGSTSAAVYQSSEAEYVEEGAVSYVTYMKYLRAGGNALVILALAVLMAGGQASFIVIDWYLTDWSYDGLAKGNGPALLSHEKGFLVNDSGQQSNISLNGVTVPSLPQAQDWPMNLNGSVGTSVNLNSSNETVAFHSSHSSEYVYGYAGLVVTVVALSILRSVAFYKVTVAASKRLHDSMFSAVVRAPIRFFDTNPAGRILNRFSMDTGNMDDALPGNLFDFVTTFMLVAGTVVMAAVVNPWVLIPLVPIVVALVIVRKVYIATSRAIKRLEAVSRSPLLSHTNATIAGLFTVRAFAAQDAFNAEFNLHQDSHTEAWYLFLCINRWFAIRLDCMCVTFITSVTFLCILAKESSIVDPSMFALTIAYAISMTAVFQWVVTQSIEVENMMTSVERIIEYSSLPSEAPLETKVRPPAGWPGAGSLKAEGISLKYADDGPDVLKNISFHINGGEKVGICGRTGAGKSSLLAMLFRLHEPTGRLTIDGVRITDIGLHDLRSRLSIIPQDPVLFDGTVRSNLDPFSNHGDCVLWDSLRRVQLSAAIENLPGGLDAAVSGGGANFSVGQRQLLCLARALLRNNKILVVDEATANVDLRTSVAVQETIRSVFSSCTVLTIAHRLNTIMDSDRIIVLDDGRVKELGEPHVLLQNPGSALHSLVQHSGAREASLLSELARAASEARQQSRGDVTRLPSEMPPGR